MIQTNRTVIAIAMTVAPTEATVVASSNVRADSEGVSRIAAGITPRICCCTQIPLRFHTEPNIKTAMKQSRAQFLRRNSPIDAMSVKMARDQKVTKKTSGCEKMNRRNAGNCSWPGHPRSGADKWSRNTRRNIAACIAEIKVTNPEPTMESQASTVTNVERVGVTDTASMLEVGLLTMRPNVSR